MNAFAYLMIFIILIGIVYFIMYKIGTYFYKLAIDVESQKNFIEDESRNTNDRQWFLNEKSHVDVFMKSQDNLNLHAFYLPSKIETKKWAILVHGYYGYAAQMSFAAKQFHEKGLQVLLVDLRGHGSSEGRYIGFGGADRQDILDWITYIKQTYEAEEVALFGVSMGGATVMMCSDGVGEEVKFIVEDCGYASLRGQFAYLLKKLFHCPAWLVLPCANMVMKKRAQFTVDDVNPIEHVRNACVPMLFIHGDKDDFLPFSMQKEVYEVCPTSKRKVVIAGAEHAKSHSVESITYWKAIMEYVDKYLFR